MELLIFPLILMVVTVGTTLFTIRNTQVYRYRMSVLEKISVQARMQIYRNAIQDTDNTSWARWYQMFSNVSYGEMIWKFWKPLDSFWPPEILAILKDDVVVEPPKLVILKK